IQSTPGVAMRPMLAFAALAFGSVQAPAQARPTPQQPAAPAPVTTVVPDSAKLGQEIAERRAAGETYLPNADVFTFGDRSIAANTRVDGPVAVARGNLDVYGTVNGDVVTLGGDVRVHKGARVTGDAWAAAGSVIIAGGVVEGRKRAIPIEKPSLPGLTSQRTAPLSTMQSVKLVCAWFALLTLIGIGVMVFAEGNLEGVVVALERGFARSFWLGLAGQVVFLPLLLVLVVGLAITVLGVLLIPFAIVAYIIAGAGLVTLGFLAVARLTGGAAASDRGTTSARGVHLRALIIGLVAYLGLWMVAALFAWNPFVGALLRAVATAITWVAATVGLGATLASRAGTQRPGAGKKAKATTDEFAWQTPTPVSGVAAATRKARTATR
ncbi:MAG TPA: polymer-forming cytoskeletal protein, partial [Gemmatimonadaceae bacterium]